MSTIDTPVTNPVVVSSSGTYASPLEITTTGSVTPTARLATGVYENGASYSVTNEGAINGGPGGYGVQLNAGTVTNKSTGKITGGTGSGGGGDGVYQKGGTLTNYNTITGGTGNSVDASGYGVDLTGGTLTNKSTGKISGGVGVLGNAGASLGGGALYNYGSIYGTTGKFGTAGVYLNAGKLTNEANASISGSSGTSDGGVGVWLLGGTMTTAGSISGGEYGSAERAEAINLGGTAKLIVQPGATFTGDIAGFGSGITIDMTGIKPIDVASDFGVTATSLGGGKYEFHGIAGSETLTTTVSQNEGTLVFSDDNFSNDEFILAPDGSGGTDITVQAVCYLRGTRIRTVTGDKAVEALAIGDCVLTASGESRPIRWLGSRALDCSRHPNPSFVWPIRIQAGAFGDAMPARDLWLSPFHSLLVEGVLIQVEKLVNGASVVQVPRERVEYWHVELDSHDILLAEGLPAESYLDVGNRTGFINGGAYLEAYPDFRAKHESESCVPVIKEGAVLERARAALLARAQALGYQLTEEADLHLLADGERIDPVVLSEQRVAFLLPAARSSIELRCRSFTPAHIHPANDDQRSLGICVNRLQLDGAEVALQDEAAFAHGWHPLEHSSSPTGQPWRWSTGRTLIPAGTRLVVIDRCHAGPYYWAVPKKSSIVALFG
jgi:Hint domain